MIDIPNAPRLFRFEKWYFDAQAEDGTFLFAFVSMTSLAGLRSAEAVVRVFRPDGDVDRARTSLGRAPTELAADRSAVAFPGCALALGAQGWCLVLEKIGCELRLDYHPMDAPWVPGGDGVLWRDGDRRLSWVVPIPRGRVAARGRIAGRSVEFDGLGYADFVYDDIPPWSLPLRRLEWGRALGPDAAVIWERPVFRSRGRDEIVARDWARIGAAPAGETEMKATTGSGRPALAVEAVVPVSFQTTRVLAREAVADMAEFGGPLRRWLYAKATRGPVTEKLLSVCEVPGAAAPLVAAHELVRWRG